MARMTPGAMAGRDQSSFGSMVAAVSLRLLTGVEGGEKGADLAGDLGDDLGLAAPIGGAGVAGGAVVQAGKLHAPAARKRPGQPVAGRGEEGQPLAPAQDEDVGGDRPASLPSASSRSKRSSQAVFLVASIASAGS